MFVTDDLHICKVCLPFISTQHFTRLTQAAHYLSPSTTKLKTNFALPPYRYFTFYKKKNVMKVAYFSEIYFHITFQDLKLNGFICGFKFTCSHFNHVISDGRKLQSMAWGDLLWHYVHTKFRDSRSTFK
jgi:hypothetical protein